MAAQPPGGATQLAPASVPTGVLRAEPTGSSGKGDTEGVTVGVPDCVAVAVAVADGDTPKVSDAVGVPVVVGVVDAADEGDGDGEHIVM